MARIFGILNVTRDSFSDGGRWLQPEAAVARGRELLADGAHVLDLGAESTHPDAEDVPAGEEIRRLAPVVYALRAAGAELSLDSRKPEVMAAFAPHVQWLNDVGGMREPAARAVAAAHPRLRLVVMFARATAARAVRPDLGVEGLLAEVQAFFAARVRELEQAGVARERIVLDPGMGFFLDRAPGPSLHVLRHLTAVRVHDLPLLVSVSRKSFVGAVTGRAVGERQAGTLAAELWAAAHGADWVRTHDVRGLRDGLAVQAAIADA